MRSFVYLMSIYFLLFTFTLLFVYTYPSPYSVACVIFQSVVVLGGIAIETRNARN